MFTKGKLYKRIELHEEFGGRRQSGISNCPKNPIIFIFSGKTGKQHGYDDGWDDDNYFWYSGEGQSGDMEFTGGNKSILNHQKDEKSIFLFEKTKKSGFWKYIDELKLVKYEYYQTPDTDGLDRKGIKFKLISVSNENEINEPDTGDVETKKKYNYNKPNVTERTGLVTSRVGQGYYRQQILEKWNNTCPVTKCNVPEILISSHIVPWKNSNQDERLDPENGILLSPNVDSLFDKHIISFTDEGEIILSTRITRNDLELLGIDLNVKINITKGMKQYLTKHRNLTTG